MKQVVLNIDEARYSLFMQFLKTLDYVQVVQASKVKKNGSKGQKRKHVLADVIGIMDKESGEELEKIVTREFQQIEGEW